MVKYTHIRYTHIHLHTYTWLQMHTHVQMMSDNLTQAREEARKLKDEIRHLKHERDAERKLLNALRKMREKTKSHLEGVNTEMGHMRNSISGLIEHCPDIPGHEGTQLEHSATGHDVERKLLNDLRAICVKTKSDLEFVNTQLKYLRNEVEDFIGECGNIPGDEGSQLEGNDHEGDVLVTRTGKYYHHLLCKSVSIDKGATRKKRTDVRASILMNGLGKCCQRMVASPPFLPRQLSRFFDY